MYVVHSNARAFHDDGRTYKRPDFSYQKKKKETRSALIRRKNKIAILLTVLLLVKNVDLLGEKKKK